MLLKPFMTNGKAVMQNRDTGEFFTNCDMHLIEIIFRHTLKETK